VVSDSVGFRSFSAPSSRATQPHNGEKAKTCQTKTKCRSTPWHGNAKESPKAIRHPQSLRISTRRGRRRFMSVHLSPKQGCGGNSLGFFKIAISQQKRTPPASGSKSSHFQRVLRMRGWCCRNLEEYPGHRDEYPRPREERPPHKERVLVLQEEYPPFSQCVSPLGRISRGPWRAQALLCFPMHLC
jgi:hypothetical protein